MTKKLTLLFFICILSTLNINAEVYEGSCGTNVRYSLDTSTGLFSITGTGAMTNYYYDSSVPWYSYRSYIKVVEIADGVTSIGNNAFNGCSGLTSVTIPNSVTSIGNYAFSSCSGLTSVTIPNSVTSIGEKAFRYCSNLTSVIIPNSVTGIGRYAFADCTSLTSVKISDNLTSIEQSTFESCSSLTSITVPNSVTSIIKYAFRRCTSLTSVVLGNNVTSIANDVFSGCSSLTDMYIYAENIPTTDYEAFNSQDLSTSTLHVPASALEAYKTKIPWSYFGNIVALGDEPVPAGIVINETNFPDANFRNYLLSQSYGSDGILTEKEIAGVTEIEGYYKQIKNIQGIEFFTELTTLWCSDNQLTSLDVSKNTRLKVLNCYTNQLTSLDVSKNTALETLSCIDNQLTSLDVSKNTALNQLYCGWNQLTSLDASKNLTLTRLDCAFNQLTSLNVSGCTKLKYLDCYENQIKGAAMDALVESLPVISNGTMNVIYNTNEGNVMTTTQVAAAKAKGWTPLYYDGSSWQEYAGSEPEVKKCATPIFAYFNGKLIIKCATEGAKYVCNLGFETDNDLTLPSKVKISLYATKDGFEPSDTITQEIDPRLLLGKIGDVNGDGEVDMSDVMFIVNKILNRKFPDE